VTPGAGADAGTGGTAGPGGPGGDGVPPGVNGMDGTDGTDGEPGGPGVAADPDLAGSQQNIECCPPGSDLTVSRSEARSRASAPQSATAASRNWAGYVAESPAGCKSAFFLKVTGSWIQPKVTCPSTDQGTKEVDFWVGLDGTGPGRGSAEQTGIEARCDWT
jgi:hypothetical protein